MTMSYENNGAVSSSTKSSEIRKIRKPLMEKKRRARINSSLNELKRILLEYSSILKEGSRPTKLEKADILELTVRHLQNLHQRIETSREGRLEGSQKDRIHQTSSVRYPALNFLCCTGCKDEQDEVLRREKTVGVDRRNDAAENPCTRKRDSSVTCSSSQISPPTLEMTRRPAAAEGSPNDLAARCSVWRPWQGLPERDSVHPFRALDIFLKAGSLLYGSCHAPSLSQPLCSLSVGAPAGLFSRDFSRDGFFLKHDPVSEKIFKSRDVKEQPNLRSVNALF